MRIGGILSVYKGDSPIFLNQALQSIIRNQTKTFDECVGVIEGEIGQELKNVCQSFSEIKWLNVSESNVFGLPKALNTAVDNDYILFLEHDSANECCTLKRTEKGVQLDKTLQFLQKHGQSKTQTVQAT